MQSHAKKILTEPLLWVGAIALCVPLFASGQMNNLRGFVRPTRSHDTIAKNLKASVDPVPVSETLVAETEVTETKVSSSNDFRPSPEPALITKSLPKVAESTEEVPISRLPLPELSSNRDPGSLVDAADSYGYEMTADPAIDQSAIEEPVIAESAIEEPVIAESAIEDAAIEESAIAESAIQEPVSEPAIDEDLELSFGDEPAAEISLDPIRNRPPNVPQRVALEQQDLPFGNLPEADSGQAVSEDEFVEPPEDTANSTAASPSPMPRSQPPRYDSSRFSYSRPPTPMRFQAALPRSGSFGSSLSQRYVETYVSGQFQQAIPSGLSPNQYLAPQTIRQQITTPSSQSQLDAISIWDE